MGLRSLLALWAGKLVLWAARAVGRAGSSLPGRVARLVDPGILTALAARTPGGHAVITGTNGKTTTAKMLAGILAVAGQRVVHNRAGANLIAGVTTAFLADATWSGRVRGSVGVLEVDEASMGATCREVRPRAAVVTNFFRDQLDRYGELANTVELVRRGLDRLAPGSPVALNADDPLCAVLGAPAIPEVAAAAEAAPQAGAAAARAAEAGPGEAGTAIRPVYYGLEDTEVATGEEGTADVRHCIRCGRPYEYEVRYYAHLGRYRCPGCGLTRPRPQVYARKVYELGPRGSTFELVTPMGSFLCRLQVPGLYNIYNALAAVAGAVALGLDLEAIRRGLESTGTAFGRMERLEIRGREVFLALVKNPVGYNEVLRTVLSTDARKNLVLCLNDLAADGTDISWIWDVNFEALAEREAEINFILCSGLRAEELAVRLKYAGFPTSKISVEPDLGRALEQGLAFVRPGELLYILPTYTAMLQMREILRRQGHLPPLWEV
ncbi:MAG: Mur ligase family protein [Firmicutes bacterium]|nr:Mur ligase family protein [Bacillota bacterium]